MHSYHRRIQVVSHNLQNYFLLFLYLANFKYLLCKTDPSTRCNRFHLIYFDLAPQGKIAKESKREKKRHILPLSLLVQMRLSLDV